MRTSVFCFLKEVPDELLRRILYGYCDGKALSTLFVACYSDPMHRSVASETISKVSEERLTEIRCLLEDTMFRNENAAYLIGAVMWLRSVARHNASIRMLSENLAVVDFMESSMSSKFCDLEKGHLEWPVWCGRLEITSTHTGTRMRNEARVVVTAPMQRPSFIPGSILMGAPTIARGRFQCEPYNIAPIPPWGTLRPLLSDDERVLRPVAQRLDHLGQVAVPYRLQQTSDTLDVRIITKTQAKRLLSANWKPRTSWILNETCQNELLCCWQDEFGELLNDRDYIPYMIDLLKAKDRVGDSSEPSSYEYDTTSPFQRTARSTYAL